MASPNLVTRSPNPATRSPNPGTGTASLSLATDNRHPDTVSQEAVINSRADTVAARRLPRRPRLSPASISTPSDSTH